MQFLTERKPLTGTEEVVTACITTDLSLALPCMLGDGRLANTTHQTPHSSRQRKHLNVLNLCVIQYWKNNSERVCCNLQASTLTKIAHNKILFYCTCITGENSLQCPITVSRPSNSSCVKREITKLLRNRLPQKFSQHSRSTFNHTAFLMSQSY